MGWQDRDYHRSGNSGSGGALMWLLTGSLPLFTLFGIRVRTHASLVVVIGLTLLLGMGPGFSVQDRVLSSTMLFAIVLLHEFGHCLTARWVGGSADEIVMHPLGGLALTQPPRRPLPVFLTVAGGPAVNVVICVVAGVVLYWASGSLPWNPFRFQPRLRTTGWFEAASYAHWIYSTSWMLLCFNLLPIFPLDGGQMLQSILWKPLGYFRSMNISCIVGMVGGVLMSMVGIATGSVLLIAISIMGIMYCHQQRAMLLSAGAYAFQDEPDYSESFKPIRTKTRRNVHRAAKRAAKLAQQEREEQRAIDAILEKVSHQGMQSLTWWEKRALRKATEHQRERDVEMSQSRKP